MNLWTAVLEDLKQTVNPQSFSTWLKPTRFVEASNSHITVRVPNQEFKDWIEEHFASEIRQALGKCGHPSTAVQFAYPETAQPKPAEKTENPLAKVIPFQKRIYPAIPDQAWHPTARRYCEAVKESTEAADSYHLAAFLVSVGALLGKSVYTQMGGRVYPNLYAVLVGKSGARKDTASSYAVDFARSTGIQLHESTTLDSREGWIQSIFDEQDRLRRDEKYFGCVRSMLHLTELQSLIDKSQQKGTKNIIPELHKAYDNRHKLEVKTRHNAISVDDCCITFLTHATPDQLERLSPTDLRAGLGNRICFIPGEPKPRKYKTPPADERIFSELRELIWSNLDFYNAQDGGMCLDLSPEAEKRWAAWYEKEYNPDNDDPMISVLSERDHVICAKVALVYAALDRATRIGLDHVKAAIGFVTFLYECRFPIFHGIAVPPYVEEEQKILQYIKDNGRVSVRTIKERFWRLSYETVDRRLKALANQGGVIIYSTGRKSYACWAGEETEEE